MYGMQQNAVLQGEFISLNAYIKKMEYLKSII